METVRRWVGNIGRCIKRAWIHAGYRTAWHVRPFLKIAGRAPLNVDIELTNVCNLRCTMCHQASGWVTKDTARMMGWGLYCKIIDECAELGVPAVKLNWRGEPLVYSKIAEAVLYAKDRGIHEVTINTNALLLTKEVGAALCRSGLDRIIISCDGIDEETYEAIRVGGSFKTFMGNLLEFAELVFIRRVENRKTPRVRINVALQAKNRGDRDKIQQFFSTISDEIRFNEIYQHHGTSGEKRKRKRRGCPQIYQRLVIDAEGNAVPCCVDWREKLKLGNVRSVGVELLYRDSVKRIRWLHEHHMARIMRGCEDCDNFLLSKKVDGKVVWE